MNDRDVTVGLNLRNSGYNRGILESAALTRMFSKTVNNAGSSLGSAFGRDLDGIEKNFGRYTDRLKTTIDLFGALGPALVPITGAAIPAVTGLAAGLGIAAAAGGTLMLAFNGIGDAVTKVNKAALSPTAAHVRQAEQAMHGLTQAGRDMVNELVSMRAAYLDLQSAAQTGLFPGLTKALEVLETRLPQVEKFVHSMGEALGQLSQEGAESLAGPQWDAFFKFIQQGAPGAAVALGEATGHLAHAMAELTMAFAGINGDFLQHFSKSAEAVDRWAAGLSKTKDFQDFVQYLHETGPMVGDLLGSIAMAFVHIAEAAAPVGKAILPLLTSMFDVIAKIADSDLGTPLLGLLALTKAMALFGRISNLSFAQSMKTMGAEMALLGPRATAAAASVGMLGQSFARSSTGISLARTQMQLTGREMALLNGRFAAFRTGGMQGLVAFNKSVEGLGRSLPRLARSVGVVGLMAASMSGLGEKIGLTNTLMGASIGLIGGGWGAAIGAGIGLLMDFAQSQELAVASAESLTDAINAQTGALNAQGYAKIGESLAGLADDADTAGIALSDVISAAAQGGAAYDELALRIQGVIDAGTSMDEATGTLVMNDAAEAASELSKALFGQNAEVNKAIGLARARQAGLDAAAEADRRAAAAADENAAAVSRLGDALYRQLTGIKALNGLLAERDATLAYNQSLIDLGKSIEENGENWDKTTVKGIANWQALDSVASAADSKLKTLQERGKDAQAQNFYRQATKDLRDFVKAHPEAAAAAKDIISTLTRRFDNNIFANTLADLHKFKTATPEAAEATKHLIDVIKTAGSGHKSLKQVLAAAQDFKSTFPGAAAAVQPLIDKLKNAGKVKIKPKVELDDDDAMRKFGRLNHGLADLNGPKAGRTLKIKVDEVDAMTRLNKVKSKVAEVDHAKANPKITAETGQAMAHLIALQGYINSMHGKTITVTTVQATVGKHAYGGLIKGQGGPMSDMVPAMLSSGEYVMRASAVSKFGVGTFDSLNRGVAPGAAPGLGQLGPNFMRDFLRALLGAGLGPGVTRRLKKEYDDLAKQIAEHREHIEKQNERIRKWNEAHPDKPKDLKKFDWNDDIKEAAHQLAKDLRQAAKEQKQAVREAFRGLKFDLASGAESIREQVSSLRDALRDAGGVWDDALQRHAKRILALARQYDAMAETLEEQQAALEKMTAFVSQVTGNFDHSGFNTDQGLAGFFAQTTTDTVRANAFTSVLQQLSNMGLSGDAFQQLAESGDLLTAQQLLAGGSGAIAQFVQAIANKNTALGGLGDTASMGLFGLTVDRQNALITKTEETMSRLQVMVDRQEGVMKNLSAVLQNLGTNMPKWTEQGSYDGTYHGVKDAIKGAGQSLVRNGQR